MPKKPKPTDHDGLRFEECPECYALTTPGRAVAHQQWHDRIHVQPDSNQILEDLRQVVIETGRRAQEVLDRHGR